MKATTDEHRPARVSERAKQAGDAAPDKWGWVERTVWTQRMLEALENGVKGGVWFSLIDKVYRPKTLASAWHRVRRAGGAAGSDQQSLEQFESRLDENLAKLSEERQTGTYRPRPIRRTSIDKPGSKEKRPLGIPAVRDRVVPTAVKMGIEPICEKVFVSTSFGFRPGKGCKDALRRVEGLLREGYTWVVDADLKSSLETSSHCTPFHEGLSKRLGWLSNTLIRIPFRLPRRTWTAGSSPRFTRCNTVWRETPSILVASSIGK